MNNKGFSVVILVGLFFLIGVIFAVYGLLNSTRTEPGPSPRPTLSQSPEVTSEPFTASFEIYTLGTKRVFSAAMYHNQSEAAYIEISNPAIIQVQTPGITWQEFFNTLPFQLSSECLTTGTSQTFCTDKDGQLKFFLNGEETPNALSLSIMPGDVLVVRYE